MTKLMVLGSTDDIIIKRAQANALARHILSRSSDAQCVEIFGSLSRGGGHADSDFDMIICVDAALAADWLIRVKAKLADEDVYESAASIRKELAFELLNLDDQDIEENTGIVPWKQDYFLFPTEWRTPAILDLLQEHGNHADPDFMRNIAQDALPYIPEAGFMFPAPPKSQVVAAPGDAPAIRPITPSRMIPMTTRQFTEFEVGPDRQGVGTLFIPDVQLLLQPARPGQYPARARHNSGLAYCVLELGNDMGTYETHIFHPGSPWDAKKDLDEVFRTYLDAACMDLWCDAMVRFTADGQTRIVLTESYGFSDGSYTMNFIVHCFVQPDRADGLISRLGNNLTHYVVARPDSSERGYIPQGFKLAAGGVTH